MAFDFKNFGNTAQKQGNIPTIQPTTVVDKTKTFNFNKFGNEPTHVFNPIDVPPARSALSFLPQVGKEFYKEGVKSSLGTASRMSLAGQGPLGIIGRQIEPYVPEKTNTPFGEIQLKYPKVKDVPTALEGGKMVAGDVGNILIAGLGSGGVAKVAEKRALNEAINTIKSEAQFLSPTEKEAAKKVAGGFFKKTQPIVTDEEKRLAGKFVDNLSSGNIVQKENAMKSFIGKKGEEMTKYLTQNNYTFTTDKLKTALKNSLDEVFSPGVKEAAKNDSINLLLSKVKKNNLLNLWEGRSSFDKVIKGLFGKDELAAADMIKKAIRDTANNFVEETLKAKKVPDVSYLPKLKDMADAYRVLDKISPKSAFELGKSGLSKMLGTSSAKTIKNIAKWSAVAMLAKKGLGGGQTTDFIPGDQK